MAVTMAAYAAAAVVPVGASTVAPLDSPSGTKMSDAIRATLRRETRADDPLLPGFLAALEARDAADHDAVIEGLRSVVAKPDASALTDDAHYLLAHTLVLERYDFAAARSVLERLLAMPSSMAYRDAATYLLAITLEQLGETDLARLRFTELRDRHTAAVLPFGYRWPARGVVARYWFGRADRRLAMLDRRRDEASAIGHSAHLADGRLRLVVNTDGIDLTLLLTPSALVDGTEWRDGTQRGRRPPPVGVYTGVVEGDSDSWVRAVVQADEIRGLVYAHRRYFHLHPDDLAGTLDYYRPLSAASATGDADDGLASVLTLDTLMAPPPDRPPLTPRRAGSIADMRRVPLSIVIDSQFDRYHAGEGLSRALAHLNVADGVYRRYGLSLALDAAITLDQAADPFALGAVPLERSLRRLRSYRLSQRAALDESALVYLFTGNPKSDVTLGLAWIDTLCRDDGYDVGVTTPLAEGGLLLAHELGHSFGARHDSETACAADRDAIMWPEVSARTETRFSTCSEESLRDVRRRACLLDGVDLSIALRQFGDTLRVTVEHADASLGVDADLSLETSLPGAIAWPTRCRPHTPGSASCHLPAIRAGERRVLELPLVATAADGPLLLSAHVEPRRLGEVDPADNRGSVEIDMQLARQERPLGPSSAASPEPSGSGAGGAGTALLLGLTTVGIGRRLSRRGAARQARHGYHSR